MLSSTAVTWEAVALWCAVALPGSPLAAQHEQPTAEQLIERSERHLRALQDSMQDPAPLLGLWECVLFDPVGARRAVYRLEFVEDSARWGAHVVRIHCERCTRGVYRVLWPAAPPATGLRADSGAIGWLLKQGSFEAVLGVPPSGGVILSGTMGSQSAHGSWRTTHEWSPNQEGTFELRRVDKSWE